MDDNRGDNVIDMKPQKLSILEMLSSPRPAGAVRDRRGHGNRRCRRRSRKASAKCRPGRAGPGAARGARPAAEGGRSLQGPCQGHQQAGADSELSAEGWYDVQGIFLCDVRQHRPAAVTHAGRRAGHHHPVRRACSHGNQARGPEPQPAPCLSQPGPRRVGARAGTGPRVHRGCRHPGHRRHDHAAAIGRAEFRRDASHVW